MPASRPLRIGWFTAGRGPGSRGMFEHAVQAIEDGSLNARIEFVFMHRERGEGEGSDSFMVRARSLGIPVLTFSSYRFRQAKGGSFAEHREEYDARVLDLLCPYSVDVGALAGYLLILGPQLTRAFKCVNLHPALPGGPVGLWKKVIWDLIETRAQETGAMTFLVTDDLDKGPPIAYARYSLRGPRFDTLWETIKGRTVAELREQADEEQPLFAAIRQEGLRREPVLLTETLKAIAKAEVSLERGAVVDAHGIPIKPRDLTLQVNGALAANP